MRARSLLNAYLALTSEKASYAGTVLSNTNVGPAVHVQLMGALIVILSDVRGEHNEGLELMATHSDRVLAWYVEALNQLRMRFGSPVIEAGRPFDSVDRLPLS